MGNESSAKSGAQRKLKGPVPCAGCKTTINSNDTSHRCCSFLGCSVICCSECKKQYLFKHSKSLYYCIEHRVNAPSKKKKKNKKKASSSATATTVASQETEEDYDEHRDTFDETPPILQQPAPTSGAFPQQVFENEFNQQAPSYPSHAGFTQATGYTAKGMTNSLGGFSVGGGTTKSINSVDLVAKMLETKETNEGGLIIQGDLETNVDGNSVRPRYWTTEEDAKLRKAVEQYGAKHWKTIATFVPGRSHVQCLQRWNKVLKPGLRKGAWTQEEDNTLIHMVNAQSPDVNWSEVSESISGRTAKQCRERWSFNLDPTINKGEWTEAEDKILIAEQKRIGNKWSQIAQALPGRTDNAIKTRYKAMIRAKKREWQPQEDERLLKAQQELGSQWNEIAALFPNRTKNAIKNRLKYLSEGGSEASNTKKPRRRKKPAAAGPNTASGAQRIANAAESVLYTSQVKREHQQPILGSRHPPMRPMKAPVFAPAANLPLQFNNPSMASLNSISMNSLNRSNRDSKPIFNDIVQDLANMEVEPFESGVARSLRAASGSSCNPGDPMLMNFDPNNMFLNEPMNNSEPSPAFGALRNPAVFASSQQQQFLSQHQQFPLQHPQIPHNQGQHDPMQPAQRVPYNPPPPNFGVDNHHEEEINLDDILL